MENRIDLHIHVGDIPAGKKGVMKNPIEGVVDYIKRSELTHVVALYTNYEDIIDLQYRLPELTIYALQWIDVNNLKKIKLDLDKPLFRGIKIHTERNCSNKKKNYIYYNMCSLSPILDKLPDDSIVLGHFQGTPTSSPTSFTRLALKYPKLKFIIGHSGNYGLMCYKPNIDKNFFEDNNKKEFMSLYINAVQSIESAVILANETQNVFLDSSIYSKHKQELFNKTDKIGFGSDYPFKPALNSKLQDQESLYLYHTWDYDLTSSVIHQRAIDFIESTWRERFVKWYKENKSKKWIAFFSQTGSELVEIIKQVGEIPELIVTNKEDLSDVNEELLDIIADKDNLYCLHNKPTLQDYKHMITEFREIFHNCFITLHGYLRIIPEELCNKFEIYNGHPGLISKYPELKGFNPQEKAYNLGLKESGSAIHRVTAEVDTGEILYERAVNIEGLTLDQVYQKLHQNSIEVWVDFLKNIL